MKQIKQIHLINFLEAFSFVGCGRVSNSSNEDANTSNPNPNPNPNSQPENKFSGGILELSHLVASRTTGTGLTCYDDNFLDTSQEYSDISQGVIPVGGIEPSLTITVPATPKTLFQY